MMFISSNKDWLGVAEINSNKMIKAKKEISNQIN